MLGIDIFFSRFALIAPIFIISLGQTGRGVLNTLIFLYFLLGLFSIFFAYFKGRNVLNSVDFAFSGIWFSIFVFSLISTFFNDALDTGFKEWIVAFLSSTVLLFSMMFSNFKNVFSSKALFALIVFSLGLFAVTLATCLLNNECIPGEKVHGMTTAVLLPLLIIPLYYYKNDKWFVYFLGAAFLCFFLLSFAESRTELLMVLFSVVVMLVFYYKKIHFIWLLPLSFVFVLFVGLFTGRDSLLNASNLYEMIYLASTNRLFIFEFAILNPPENIFWGSGINNTMAYLPENPLNSAFHNAFLEIWYETGFIGLILWMALIFYSLRTVLSKYKDSNAQERILYTAFLGSLVAVLVAGLFDKGYMSSYYKFYIFYIVAVLNVLSSSSMRRAV